MKKKISLILILTLVFSLTVDVANAKLVACVGDSITYGYGLPNRASNCYPAQLARILQEVNNEWETQNFGVSGATLLRKGHMPYVVQSAYNRALESEPEVVIIMLGTNDSWPPNWAHKDDFIPDYLALIDAFAQLPSQPKIFVGYPPPVFSSPYHDNIVIREQIIPLIDQLPTYKEVQLIDLYTPLEESRHLFPDGIHPNTEGAKVMAKIVASVILGFRFLPDFNGDGKVDIEDLIILIEHWNQDQPSIDIAPPPFGDGIVEVQDLEVVMQYWGQDVNDPTLVAHWALDESEGTIAQNSVGINDAVTFGDPHWQPTGGQVDGAIQLDGKDDCVIISSNPNPTEGPFSVLIWIKGGAPDQVILSKIGGANWLLADPVEGNLMTELAGPGPTGGPMLSQTNITDGNWHRIGFIWDGTHRMLYVDNVVVAEDTQDGLEASSSGLYIGTGKAMQPGTYFSGLIDDIRIYNRAVRP